MKFRELNIPGKQKGAVLIVSLLMLLVTTLLGITSMSTTVMEEKMVGNSRQKQLAFQGAEAALRAGEVWLRTSVISVTTFETLFNTGGAAELYWERGPTAALTTNSVAFDIYNPNAWAIGNSIQTTQALQTNQPNPRYIIEYMGRTGEAPLDPYIPDDRRYAFRVTAIGEGTDNITNYVTRSTFRIPLI